MFQEEREDSEGRKRVEIRTLGRKGTKGMNVEERPYVA